MISMIWPVTARIYWDLEKNVPLIKPPPGSSNNQNIVLLKLTEPGDARPATARDMKLLSTAILNEFRSLKIYNRFFENRFILLNKVPHWDQMWEVIADGNVLGQLYYDPFSNLWRFRLNSTGAYLATTDGLVDYVIVESKKIREKTCIRKNYSSSSRQVVIATKDLRPLGIAENIPGKGLYVTKVFKSFIKPVASSKKPCSVQEVLKANEYGLYYFESRAKAFIHVMYTKVNKDVVVSYSGGKDSLVSLHLVQQVVDRIKLLFNNTGLELPETLNNIDVVSRMYDTEVVVADAGDSFWKAVEVFGPPGKDYRWCCKVVKLVPLARITRVKWPLGALNIVGQRAFESIDRAKSPRVWRNRWIPSLLSISPIQEWTQLHVWLYIYKYKLPYNKAYDLGFERLGCFLCPSSTLAELKTLEEIHPELWSKWISVLRKWQKKLGLQEEWIKYGLWRWLTPSKAKYRLIHQIKNYKLNWKHEYLKRLEYNRIGVVPVHHEKHGGKKGVIVFNKKLLQEKHLEYFRKNIEMLNYIVQVNKESQAISIKTDNIKIEIKDNLLEYSIKDEKDLEEIFDVIKIIYRIYGCVRCGSCVIWCPDKSVKLDIYGPLPKTPCSACRICIRVCPIAEVLTEKVVIPLILDRYDAWRRSTKTYREDVIESFKLMGLIP